VSIKKARSKNWLLYRGRERRILW